MEAKKTLISKAVIPAAGLGTRFLPATKSQPKEMLPVVDKPAIQYVIEEAIANGLTDILLITGRGKRSIEDHFDRSLELEQLLEAAGKHEELAEIRKIASLAVLHYVRQGEPLGLGDAIARAAGHVGSDPFVVLLADDLMEPGSPLLSKMLDAYAATSASILALMEVPPDQISSYGCAEVIEHEDGTVEVVSVVEKPRPEDAPSLLAITGRYLFTPHIFSAMARTHAGYGGEIQLTDGITQLLKSQRVFAVTFREGRYDIGDKVEYLRAVVQLALKREDLGPKLLPLLRDILKDEPTP